MELGAFLNNLQKLKILQKNKHFLFFPKILVYFFDTVLSFYTRY